MSDYQKQRPGYIDQTAKTLPNQVAQRYTPPSRRNPPIPRNEPVEPSLGEVMSAIQSLASRVEIESNKNEADRSLTNAAIHVLQQEVEKARIVPRVPSTIPPPAVVIPARNPMESTGQHAIVVAGAALQAAENAHAAATAATEQVVASIDYAREQERAKAEMFQNFAEIVKEGRKSFGKFAAIGGLVFAIISGIAGYVTTKAGSKDVAREAAAEVVRTTPSAHTASDAGQ